ncbi:hypothetical protein C1646_752181 [Rhizophagus diaphanus]|nr:hypothetical protein C1646_752181 [Rhizophagus diaphanus] [Rhizophagus sp. MUCL 43196]
MFDKKRNVREKPDEIALKALRIASQKILTKWLLKVIKDNNVLQDYAGLPLTLPCDAGELQHPFCDFVIKHPDQDKPIALMELIAINTFYKLLNCSTYSIIYTPFHKELQYVNLKLDIPKKLNDLNSSMISRQSYYIVNGLTNRGSMTYKTLEENGVVMCSEDIDKNKYQEIDGISDKYIKFFLLFHAPSTRSKRHSDMEKSSNVASDEDG